MITPRPGLFAVILREVRRIRRDHVAAFLLFGVPVIAFALLGLTFSSAVVRGLGVVVVDMDHSAMSRMFIQTVAAAPGIAVVKRADDLGAAASAIRSGEAIAAIYLPPDFEKELLAGRRPRPIAYYNTQYFAPGNSASKSISDAMTAASTAVAPATMTVPHTGGTTPGLVPEEYVLTNPALSYAEFLLRAVLPTVLHVVIAISAAYAVGSEFRRRGIRAWWEISGQSIAMPLVGKLLPYWLVLFTMFALMVGILDVALGVSFRGNVLLTAVSATLLIVAYQMVGCLMQLLARNLAVGLSLTAIIVLPAFGYAGVGFPVTAMGWSREPGARCCRCAGMSRSCSIRPRAVRRCVKQWCHSPSCVLSPSLWCCWYGCASARLPAAASKFRPTRNRHRTVRCSVWSARLQPSGGAC